MSTPENQQGESRSSVKISTNAKGDVQVEVKAYTGDLDQIDEVRAKAVATFQALQQEVGA